MGFSRKTTLVRRFGPSPAAADALATELDRLERLELGELRAHYRNCSGRIAPARISRALLLRVLAYRIQVDAFGDLSRDTRRLLHCLGLVATGGAEEGVPSAVPPAAQWSLKPGTLLDREWQGRMERVMVREDGFAWNGTSYASLSAAAFAITGTKWNGYRFFGLHNGRTTHVSADAPGKVVARQDERKRDDGGPRPRCGVTPRAQRCVRAATVESASCLAPPSVGGQP